jgi:hypothetical protein
MFTNQAPGSEPEILDAETVRQVVRSLTGPTLLIKSEPLVEKGGVLLVAKRLLLVNPTDREELEKSLEWAGVVFREADPADHEAFLEEVLDPLGRGPFVAA